MDLLEQNYSYLSTELMLKNICDETTGRKGEDSNAGNNTKSGDKAQSLFKQFMKPEIQTMARQNETVKEKIQNANSAEGCTTKRD